MKTRLFIILTFLGSNLFAQNSETENWYFGGRAGLNFEITNNDPQVLLDGMMSTPSGSAVISDLEGNLLFYTEGDLVWNKNHQRMDNGNLSNVTPEDVGNNLNYQTYQHALQNSMIIPITDTEGLYYLFTVGRSDENLIVPEGLYLSIIDMTQNNGLGRVIEKNRRIIRPGTEIGKLSAVHHANGRSIWLMTTVREEGNLNMSFYAYKINMDGSIEPTVVSSGSGVSFDGLPLGNLKFSPNGKRVACSNYRPAEIEDHLFVFDFDDETGIVSNRRKLLTSLVPLEIASVHGIEFSNNSEYLYASLVREGFLSTVSLDVEPDPKGLVIQYNLADNFFQTYSTILYENEGVSYGGALQLSKNGKIYRALPVSNSAGTSFLGVINDPNEFGTASNYLHNQINLNSRVSRRGLPNFIQSYFRTRILNIEGCEDDSILFEVDTYAEITAAEWNFGDGNTSSEITPNYTYNDSGSYDVSVTITVNNRQITTSKRILVNELPNLNENQELIQCDDNSDGISVFNLFNIRDKITDPSLNEELIFYSSLSDAEGDDNRILNPENFINEIPDQEIFIKVINENDCYSIGSFIVTAVFAPPIVISDVIVCDSSDNVPGDSLGFFSLLDIRGNILNQLGLLDSSRITFYSTFFDAQTSQNDLRNISSGSTTIWVRVEDENLNCGGIGSIDLIVNPEPSISLNDQYILCGTEPITLSGDSSNYRFEWLDSNNNVISTSQNFSTTETGTYTHVAFINENDLECSLSKEFNISRVEAPVFSSIDVIEGSNVNTINISVEGNSSYEFSIDGINFFGNSNNYTFNGVPFGAYTIYAKDISGCEPAIEEDIFLIGYPKFFTPNEDGVNDFWAIKGLDVELYESIRIFNRYGKLITDLNVNNGFRWNGEYNGVRLPVNDYWFEVKFKNGLKKVGHFTLKR
ncbi:T9SS type B sorting domain-containing protein [Winogradskyella luteola]|uniref:T9SS type B sorting domain-containing protein n=1 Tax=Winogradskyella luteola TaxID=2828330 RepID=A0A9X1JPQ8_9FLAO|nr:T9SS type B sorting domain-containing protein [Winogradskyella luteola]MBV7268944.1 T9SS type B sorting domain-containing protein [Winogradskyella luteola]